MDIITPMTCDSTETVKCTVSVITPPMYYPNKNDVTLLYLLDENLML